MEIKIDKSVIALIGSVLAVIIISVIVLFMLLPKSETVQSPSQSSQISQTVSVSEFETRIADPQNILLDIRTPSEFNSGRIAGAINIDYYEPGFQSELEKLDKEKQYIIYCNSGNRTSSTLAIMKKMGFKNVVDLRGGITAWKQAGKNTCTSC